MAQCHGYNLHVLPTSTILATSSARDISNFLSDGVQEMLR
jgi:hypothetical protein